MLWSLCMCIKVPDGVRQRQECWRLALLSWHRVPPQYFVRVGSLANTCLQSARCLEFIVMHSLLYILVLLIDDISQITPINLFLKNPHTHSGIKYIRVPLYILPNDTCNSRSPISFWVRFLVSRGIMYHDRITNCPSRLLIPWVVCPCSFEKKGRKSRTIRFLSSRWIFPSLPTPPLLSHIQWQKTLT